MTGPGIDYGMGLSNIDRANGIRYGVISQHSVTQAWCDSAEADYGKPTCPKCGGDAVDASAIETDEWPSLYSHSCVDYACENCQHTLDSGDVFGDEPQGWSFSGDGYELVDCLDSDIMVLKSPYYTMAPFCSPCVPGAGNLNSARDGGVKAYCLGHDWFEDGKAPYPVFSVETSQLVAATQAA